MTSGASAPEKLVERVCDWFRARGVTEIEAYRLVDEDVEFRLPIELRRELDARRRAVAALGLGLRPSPAQVAEPTETASVSAAIRSREPRAARLVRDPEPDPVGDLEARAPCAAT